MSVVLAVEPDSAQAEVLRKALRRIDAELTVVSTTAAAIGAVNQTLPDLILVSALFSPRDEDALFAHLRSLDGSSHLQTLTIPQLRRGKASTNKGGSLSRFRRKPAASEPAGCDPALFAEEVRAYLARAHEVQSRVSEMAATRAIERPIAAVPPPPVEAIIAVDEQVTVEGPSRPNEDSWVQLDVDALFQLLESERLENPMTVDEVQTQLTAEIERFELQAQQRRETDLVRAQVEAQARLTAEVERVQAEAEERRQHELARVQAEAEVQRQAAVNQARAAAESEARSALAAELEQVRLSEIARVQAEADQRCDVVASQAREAAEAARAMMEELARIRAQVEETLNSRLEQARAETEKLREVELARAQAEAAALRDAAAQDARLAAEAAASRALEAEVARVRADAETRLQVELDVIRQEAEHLRRADQSKAKQTAEKVHAAAVRDARAIAEAANQTLEAELVRVRVEADARLEAELAKARDQAERQRATELEDIRTQVAEMRETAAQQARQAAAEAIASEVVRSASENAPAAIETTPLPVEPQPAAASASDYYSLWTPRAEPVAEQAPADAGAPESLVWFIGSKWALPVAAALLLVVGTVISVGWSWRPHFSKTTPAPVVVPVERATAHIADEVTIKTGELRVETDPPGAHVLLDGGAAGDTPRTLSKLKPGRHTLVLQSSTGTLTKKIVVRAGEITRVSESIFSGWLAVFAGIPLKIYVGGQLRGTTDDGQVMLSPGAYDVELVSERFNYRETKTFAIESGKTASYTVSLPTGVIRLNSPDGTDVSIDGQTAGRTPLGDLPVPIGTHEVVGTNPEMGERRQSIEVKLGAPAEITLK